MTAALVQLRSDCVIVDGRRGLVTLWWRDSPWLHGHGNVEVVAAPIVSTRPEDRWIEETF